MSGFYVACEDGRWYLYFQSVDRDGVRETFRVLVSIVPAGGSRGHH